ncbi:MAG: amidohydrolase family protein [Flavobacteriales bacterium]
MAGCGMLSGQIPIPAPPQDSAILLMNGIAHIGNGNVIENSLIAFEKGRITLVADATNIRIDLGEYRVIHIDGKHVYPGMITPNSTIGITEIGAVRATHDFREVGKYNPEVRSLIAYNSESRITPTVRTNGVLIGQITPRGGIISGTSSIVQFDAWNWEDAVIKSDDGIHLNWPSSRLPRQIMVKKGKVNKFRKQHLKTIDELENYFRNAKAYAETADPPEVNLRMEAMRGLFDGSKTLFVHAQYAKDITEALAFTRSFMLPKVVLVGGYDAWRITDIIKDNHIPVILRRIYSLPVRPGEDPDLPFKMPRLLQRAGVLFCLDNSGDMEAMQTRNLPFMAGTAAAYGLSKEQALSAVTYNAARILGIDEEFGTLQEGKSATLFVSDGDALDIKTNRVVYTFIHGRQIDLDNPQKYLYRKYKARLDKQ